MNSSLMLEKLDSEQINGSAHFSLTSFKSKLTPAPSRIDLTKYQHQLAGASSHPTTSNFNSNSLISSLIKSSPFASLSHFKSKQGQAPNFRKGSQKGINLVDKYQVSELTLSKSPIEDFERGSEPVFTPRRVGRESLPVFEGSPDPPFESPIPFSQEIEFLVSENLFKKEKKVPNPDASERTKNGKEAETNPKTDQIRLAGEDSHLARDSPKLEIPSEDFFSDFSAREAGGDIRNDTSRGRFCLPIDSKSDEPGTKPKGPSFILISKTIL